MAARPVPHLAQDRSVGGGAHRRDAGRLRPVGDGRAQLRGVGDLPLGGVLPVGPLDLGLAGGSGEEVVLAPIEVEPPAAGSPLDLHDAREVVDDEGDHRGPVSRTRELTWPLLPGGLRPDPEDGGHVDAPGLYFAGIQEEPTAGRADVDRDRALALDAHGLPAAGTRARLGRRVRGERRCRLGRGIQRRQRRGELERRMDEMNLSPSEKAEQRTMLQAAEAKVILDEKNKRQAALIEEAITAELKKCPEDQQEILRQALDTPGDERDADQKKLLASYPNLNINGGNLYQYNNKGAEEVKSYDKKASDVRGKKPPHPYVRALTEAPGVQVDTKLYHRGDAKQPTGDPLVPAPLTITASPGERPAFAENDPKRETTGRRTAYAKWLTNGRHPLVARVLVNRIWMHHFGEGLVPTPGEFGILGARPTHPELLDYLAHEFMTNGWSVKHMHRLIMRSTVYRQSSVASPSTAERKFAKWPLHRLDAETLRDRTLVASGVLTRTQFGEPVPVKANDAGQFRIDSNRRSIYAQVRRSKPITFLQSFDAPDMKTNCNRRPTSNAATQALVVMNGDFHLAQAKNMAERVRKAGDLHAQIKQAFARAYSRPPSESEIQKSQSFLETEGVTLELFCHTLLSSNEFLYVD